MKSKKKFLSLLVFAPLLVGCGNKVQAPKFADYGKKMASYEAFKTAVEAELAKTSLKKAAKIGSYEVEEKKATNVDAYDSGSRKTERDKKVISETVKHFETTYKTRYSAEDLILSSERKDTESETSSDANGSSTSGGSSTSKTQFQEGKINKKKHILYVDITNKKYQSVKEVGSDEKPATLFDGQAKDIGLNYVMGDMNYFNTMYTTEFGDEMKAKCSFYKNGKIYTAEIKYEVKQSSENSDYKCNYNCTVQVDLTEGNFSSKFFEEEIAVDTYKKSCYSGTAKGDVVTETKLTSNEVSLKMKKVSGKAVDISKFALISL